MLLKFVLPCAIVVVIVGPALAWESGWPAKSSQRSGINLQFADADGTRGDNDVSSSISSSTDLKPISPQSLDDQTQLLATLYRHMLMASLQPKERTQPLIKTNKRHCWDVFDFCCIANACSPNHRFKRQQLI